MIAVSSGLPGQLFGRLMGRTGGHLWASLGLLGLLWLSQGVPGPSDPIGSRLGTVSGRNWGPLGAFRGRLGGHLGRLGGLLGPSRGRLGGLLGRLGAVLGAS